MQRIGDVAHATGLTPRAIRYYEELGLLAPAVHTSGGNRRYDDGEVQRLLLIKRLREDVGLSLSDIKTYLDIEEVRRALKSEYAAAADPNVQLVLLDRIEPIIRRRIALLDRKLEAVAALRGEDEAILERIASLRIHHLNRASLAAAGA